MQEVLQFLELRRGELWVKCWLHAPPTACVEWAGCCDGPAGSTAGSIKNLQEPIKDRDRRVVTSNWLAAPWQLSVKLYL